MKKILKILLICLFLTSCLEEKKSDFTPNPVKFKKDTELMINISHRLANETKTETLHRVAVATQSARVINCIDYAGECEQFRAFLSATIKFTSDNELTPLERTELKSMARSLKSTIIKARGKLQLKKQ